MEKNSTEILREIEASLAEVKEKVRLLEEQLALEVYHQSLA